MKRTPLQLKVIKHYSVRDKLYSLFAKRDNPKLFKTSILHKQFYAVNPSTYILTYELSFHRETVSIRIFFLNINIIKTLFIKK